MGGISEFLCSRLRSDVDLVQDSLRPTQGWQGSRAVGFRLFRERVLAVALSISENIEPQEKRQGRHTVAARGPQSLRPLLRRSYSVI
jgi:hypothetical protein